MTTNPNPTYLNFDLLITRAGDAYRAYVVDAPGGDADVTFEMPFAPDELVRLVHGEGTRRGLRLAEDDADQLPPRELRDLGSQLYETVFHDDVREVLVASQTDADSKGQELRIRLRFADDAVDLATLPWEILFDSTQQHFLALNERRPILRYLSLPRPRPALVVQPPLSILAVLASPSDHNPLNVEQEWQAMEAALTDLRDDGKIKLERLESPTFDALRERLLGDPVHVLHFVGHGIYDEEKGEGQLLFEEPNGRGRRVPAVAVAQLLHNHAPMRLAYLNACEGAIADKGNVFAGMAQTLVQQGVPAAVAMQDEITDAAAIEMARTFYTALATGRPVDAALTHARVALSTRDNDEWAIPVLFSRSPDNRLFDIREVLPTPTCPYPGMRPFTEAQQDLFFGRDKEIADAVTALSRHPFLTVVGPSGSGKSSLSYAGIIPALRKSTRFGDANEVAKWTIKTMRPSDSRTPDGDAAPMKALSELLPHVIDDTATGQPITDQPITDHQSLLFIDQFEEVFTLAEATEAQHFLTILHQLIGTPNLYILLTVRADFYPDLMTTGDLWQSIKANRLELTPLGDDELWAAIVQPAAKVGVTVEDALAVALLADASGESGVLPLVQETLVLLWEKVDRRTLTLDAYRAMADGGRSGLQVAIDQWADDVYKNKLSPEAQPIARRIFLRLIQFGQGRADTRRQQTVDELRASSDDPAIFDQALTTLADNRLITTSGEEGDSQRQVDISHEALIAGWDLLQGWIEEQREAETTRRRLEEKASEWVRLEKSGGLLDEFEIQEANLWLDGNYSEELGYSKELIALISKSQQVLAEIETKNAEAERTRQRSRIFARGLMVAAIVIGIVGYLAWSAFSSAIVASQAEAAALWAQDEAEVAATKEAEQRQIAEVERRNAEHQADAAATSESVASVARSTAIAAESEAQMARRSAELASQSLAELDFKTDTSGDLALLLALESVNTTWQENRYVSDAALYALNQAVQTTHSEQSDNNFALHAFHHENSVWFAEFNSDGSRIVSASIDGTARVWDTDTGNQVGPPFAHPPVVRYAEFSPDGKLIATVGDDMIVRIWDANANELLFTLDPPLQENENLFYQMWTASFSPDGQFIVAPTGNAATVWEISSQRIVRILIHDLGDSGAVSSATFSPVGQSIVTTGDDHTAKIWNANTGELIHTLIGHTKFIPHAAFSPDGKRVVTSGWDNDLKIWDIETGELLHNIAAHTSYVSFASFNPKGDRIVSAGQDNTAKVWDAKSGRLLFTLIRHSQALNSAVFSPDGQHILTASGDGTVQTWLSLEPLLDLALSTVKRDPPALTNRERIRYGFEN